MAGITPIVMPKWGLSMKEGTVMAWLVEEGASIAVGTPILDVETDKIANAVEAADPGILRRKVAREGETLPVKALLGVMAEPSVSDAEIDAFIANYVVPASDESEEEAAAAAYQFIDIEGIRVRYARRGAQDGTPVLLLHGFGGDLDNWLFNLDAIAEIAPVVALDLPAHGQSDAKLPGPTLAALGAFVVRFLDRLDVTQAHLVGHSLGGAIAARIALEYPQRVASLALVNSAGLGEEINGSYIDGFVRASSRKELKPVLEQLFADPTLVSRQMIDDLLKYKRLDGVTDALGALAGQVFPGGRQAEQPGREVAPTGKALLVVWGRDDRIVPSAHATNAPQGAVVEVLPDSGHMVMLERATEFNSLLKRHLQRK